MRRVLMLGTVAALGLGLLTACNQNTASNAPPADAPQTAANEPQPGTNSEAVSALQDAVAGGVGAVSAELTTTTKGFVEAAAMGDMYEIEASKLAADRAPSADVKKFAQDMIAAHTKTSAALKGALAKSKEDIALPAALDDRHQGMIDNLTGAKDQDFENRYVAQQVNAHNEALILMRGYAKDGDNADLKAVANEAVPIVQMHLDTITEIDRAHRTANTQVRDNPPRQ
jgi:putative membrane protein